MQMVLFFLLLMFGIQTLNETRKNMNKELIIIMGYPASGKTILAREYEERGFFIKYLPNINSNF